MLQPGGPANRLTSARILPTPRYHVIRFALPFALAAATPFFAQDDPYQEEDGLIVMEAESMDYDTTFWSLESSIEDYRGTGYLVGQVNRFNAPGTGVIRYPFTVSATGVYQLQWRSRITAGTSHTDFNDSWARMTDADGIAITPNENDLEPNGEWYKVYMNQIDRWSNQSSNHDNNPRALLWSLQSGQTYYFETAVRSQGHGIDRIVLYRRGTNNFANLTGRTVNNSTVNNDSILDALPESRRLSEIPILADDDNDGLSNEWEALHSDPSSTTAIDPASDDDQDTLTALQEFLLGTDPNQFTPLPKASLIEIEGSYWLAIDFSLSHTALQLVEPQILFSTDLIQWSSEGITLETELSEPDENLVSAARARILSQELNPTGFFHLGAVKR